MGIIQLQQFHKWVLSLASLKTGSSSRWEFSFGKPVFVTGHAIKPGQLIMSIVLKLTKKNTVTLLSILNSFKLNGV